MLERWKHIDAQFTTAVLDHNLPKARSHTQCHDANLTAEQFLQLFDAQLASRHLDLIARVLKEKGLSFYTIGSSGHEGNAAIGARFRHTDMAFLHYRSGALMLARANHVPQIDMVQDILLSLVASSSDPISAGRHKVFGSVPLYVPPQTSTIASHLPKAVGAAFSITRAKELNIAERLPDDSVILCNFGDASANHSTSQGAFNSAEWIAHSQYPLPIVFICEDNGIGISVPTPQDWIEATFSRRAHLHYIQCDGLNVADVYEKAGEAEYIARIKKKPVFLHMKTVRLMGHAGSDIESEYLTERALQLQETNDPLLHSARIILEHGFLTPQQIVTRYEEMRTRVAKTAEQVLHLPKLTSAEAVMASIVPPVKKINPPAFPATVERQKILGERMESLEKKRTLAQLLNLALSDLLLQYPNLLIFGEDVGKKGGVYHVTANLQQRFGKRRVFDSLLDEQTILGIAIGLALNGFIPIPEIQFLAYTHNAADQIRGEAATMSFFSSGQYTNPMVIRIAGLAYQRGFGGHFHNDNALAFLREIPGIVIACPSNGRDAVLMLREAVRLAHVEQRVVVFVEPIALYAVKDLHQKGDNGWLCDYPRLEETIACGTINVTGDSQTLAIISYGNGYYLSCQAAEILVKQHQIPVKLIDLRWLAPLNIDNILTAIADVQHVLIVDECRQTGSLSEMLMTLIIERMAKPPRMARVTGRDSFIPLGKAWEYVLPSCEDIVARAVEYCRLG